MIHSASAIIGPPITASSSPFLSRSIKNTFTLERLKPKRSSMTNVWYRLKGSSSSVMMTIALRMTPTPVMTG